MKLFARYNRINLLATVFIFLIASLVFYFFLRKTLYRQVDEDLEIEQTEIERYVNRNHRFPEFEQQPDQQIFYQLTTAPMNHRRRFKTIAAEAGEEDVRQLSFNLQLPDGLYTVTVRKSLEGTDNLTRTVALLVLGMVVLILAVSLLINRLVLQRLWRPFYSTLSAVRQFRLGSNEPLQLPPSGTDEFALLNAALRQATEKAGQDYQLLKEFTENASHELQTPLAIIRSKLELLMQDDLSEPQLQTIQQATGALQSLVRLNKSLLLLTKIQNNQYGEKEIINIKKIIAEKIDAFEELIIAKGIQVQAELEESRINMNPDLANMLVSNLLSNAVKHNKTNGTILIRLTSSNLLVENTGTSTSLDESRLFTRFYNPEKALNSTGLGLSIVQQICQVSGFAVSYRYSGGLHSFIVAF